MNQKRPVNLDLGTLAFPPMAIASILHRISGVVLFLLLPVMLYLLDFSLQNAENFIALKTCFGSITCRVVLWSFCSALFYHLLAGIRHLCMDMGYGEQVKSGRRSAVIVIALSIILSIVLGIWIW